jgi:hypothetical protein
MTSPALVDDEKLAESLAWWETHDGIAERRIDVQRARMRIQSLSAEVARLREALVIIRTSLAGQKSPVAATIVAWCNDAISPSRAALSAEANQ